MNEKIKKGLKVIKKNPKRLMVSLVANRMFGWIPDEKFLRFIFYCRTGNKLNFDNPKTFNEKLQWLKVHDHNPEYVKLVDKYTVRDYIADTIGGKYLIPLIGVYDNFDEIDFDKLPNAFVLKCTHDSGGVVICKDKSNFNIRKARKKINNSLKRNFYYPGREWPYKEVKPRIICEKYMVDDSGVELKDYKFLCFNGKARCLFVCLNRNEAGVNVDFYDMNWNPLPFERHYPRSNKLVSKPKNFDKMVEFAENISKNKPFVRVDFYEANEQLYFGELTFYPGSGFEKFNPSSYDELLGSWINLPQKDIK